jgi:tRNA (guanine6-N2)-methyltransferase
MMEKIFALTTRGLEAVSAGELAALPGVTVTKTAYRRVAAVCEGSLEPPLGLRTVDDVYLDVGTWEGIGHTRESLAVLQWYATQIEMNTAAETIGTFRPLPPEPVFSITASFVGRRNYSTDEIKKTVAEGVRSEYRWQYTSDDRTADLNVRVFMEHELAYVGVRLGKHPLHERAYKLVERAGALKPSVAAAMLRLAELKPGQRLLDPCCGSGTILIEAALSGAITQGGDLDVEAVEAARANAQAAGVNISIKQWDARKLPLEAASVDYVMTNLPWGRQIVADEGLYQDMCREIERVLKPNGRALLLTNAPELLRFERLKLREAIEISLFGQTPVISIFDKQ